MCGIAGYFSNSRVFQAEELKNMANAMAHRGPDADGFFSDDCVGLCHRRLKIIDLSDAANQPMASQSERFVMVFNGEIYNYDEIRREFQIPVKTTSDTEVILELFDKIGVRKTLELCNGMFAIALYDKQEKKLSLIRDRMGIKPLHYYWDGKNLAFASEIKSLLQLSYIAKSKSMNYSAINEFLHLGYTGKTNTAYSNIFKLEAGNILEISQEKINILPYWCLLEKIQKETITDFVQAREILRDLVEDSVRYRLKSDVDFGAFLSGGIDSSLVAAVAQRNLSTKLKTFTIGFKDAKHNESEFARKVSEYLGTEHYEMLVTEKDAIDLVPNLLNVYDEPFADSSAFPTMLVSKLAKQHVSMTLSGDGGDELFMGYGAYNWAKRLENPLVQNFRKPISAILSCGKDWHKRGGKVFNYDSKENIPSHIFSQEQGFFSRNEISKLLNPQFRTEINLEQNPCSLARKLTACENQAVFDMRYYLCEDLLTKVDRASMQYSLESRVPLLDYNIVEFALNVSQDLKIKNKTQKYLLRQVLFEYIPAELFQRPKWGFSIPLQSWLQTDLQFLIHDYLNEKKISEYGLFDSKEVKNLTNLFLKKGQKHLYNRIWSIILVQKFMEEKL